MFQLIDINQLSVREDKLSNYTEDFIRAAATLGEVSVPAKVGSFRGSLNLPRVGTILKKIFLHFDEH